MIWRRAAVIIALALVGCSGQEQSWLDGNRQRCAAMGGHSAYSSVDRSFECFASKTPFSFKIEFNKAIDFKQPETRKLFEARYDPK